MAHFIEPSFLIYSLDSPNLSKAASELEAILPPHLVDDGLLKRSAANIERRVLLQKSCVEEVVCYFATPLFRKVYSNLSTLDPCPYGYRS